MTAKTDAVAASTSFLPTRGFILLFWYLYLYRFATLFLFMDDYLLYTLYLVYLLPGSTASCSLDCNRRIGINHLIITINQTGTF